MITCGLQGKPFVDQVIDAIDPPLPPVNDHIATVKAYVSICATSRYMLELFGYVALIIMGEIFFLSLLHDHQHPDPEAVVQEVQRKASKGERCQKLLGKIFSD
ncbi:hypothetical protein Tco_1493030 [Tanacetum coccineum]